MAKPLDRIEVGKHGPVYFLGGKAVPEEQYRAAYPLPPVGNPGDCFAGNPTTGWPIHSLALGYHASQREEAKEYLKKVGVPTDIDFAGRPVITDAGHARRLHKALGVHYNNSNNAHG